jgi:predicted phage tail protein
MSELMSNKGIRGAKGGGGGGGGSYTPVESDDSLFSTASAQIIDLVSEGEIVGLLNGPSSIFLDESPMADSNGNYNFDEVLYATRKGTNSQSYIPGFEGTQSSVNVNLQVKKGTPGAIIKSFSSSVVDAINIMLFTPVLSHSQDNGDITGSAVSFLVYIQKDNSGTWEQAISGSFSGKTVTRYERLYRVEIPSSWKSSGFTQVSIKVERTTDDSTSSKINNSLYWAGYSQVIDNKLRYPNSAIMALYVNAKQFSSTPKRAYEIKGIKIKVPSNYTPYDPGHCSLSGYRSQHRCEAAGGTWTGTASGQNLYSGSWDGTFDIAWTCNPAWILYDLCTDERYGLGKWLDSANLDKWALYEVAKYCDAVDNSGNFVGVSNGWNGLEARFACHIYIQGRKEAFKILNDISSVFRGMLYWQEGQITAVQDSPKDPVMSFSNSNVIDGRFSYEGSSRKQRHNVAHVTWNNPEDFYRRNVEYVEDREGISSANNQIFSTEVSAIGCTSQSQAHRVGRWILYTEKNETEAVTFSTGLEGAAVRPGDIIKIADSHKAGVRYGGRVATGSSSTIIQLDTETPVVSGRSYTLSLVHTEEACIRGGVKQSETSKSTCLNANTSNKWSPHVWVETKQVNTVTSTEKVDSITVTSAFDATPSSGVMWVLEETDYVEAAEYRVLSVKETSVSEVEVSALKYHAAKFASIEEGVAFSSKSISNLPDPEGSIPSPSNLTISEELYIDSMSNVKNRATFSWDAPNTAGTATTYPYIASYYVEWRRKAPAITNWTSMGETSAQSITIDDAPAGTLEFRVKTRRIF